MAGAGFLGLGAAVTQRLVHVVGFTFAFQFAFASYAVPNKTEKYYDLAGSLGMITTTLLSLYYPSIRSLVSSTAPKVPFSLIKGHDPRQLLISSLYVLWAGRLGSYLVQRIQKQGRDSRFDEIKTKPAIFSGAWLGQCFWVTAVTLPAVLVNLQPARALPGLGPLAWAGLGVWAAGIGLEILADQEKSNWRKAKDEKKHDEKFISSGLWALSRHPNYLGETILQLGPPLLAYPCLPSASLRALAFISPVFTYLLLRYASGVPPLEKASEKKWGEDEKWRKYVRETSVLVPWPGGAGTGKV